MMARIVVLTNTVQLWCAKMLKGVNNSSNKVVAYQLSKQQNVDIF
jgi:hypothetical protein